MAEKKTVFRRAAEWTAKKLSPLGIFMERIALRMDSLFSALLPRVKIGKKFSDSSRENRLADITNETHRFINDQGSSATLEKLRFGKYSLNYNGCGIIALYNAMSASGCRASVADITDTFVTERLNTGGSGMSGKYGTNPFSIGRGIKRLGFECSRVSADEIMRDGLYVAAYWRKSGGFFSPAHFIAVETRNGVPTAYNNSDRNEAETVDVAELKKKYICGYRLTR